MKSDIPTITLHSFHLKCGYIEPLTTLHLFGRCRMPKKGVCLGCVPAWTGIRRQPNFPGQPNKAASTGGQEPAIISHMAPCCPRHINLDAECQYVSHYITEFPVACTSILINHEHHFLDFNWGYRSGLFIFVSIITREKVVLERKCTVGYQ